MEKRITNLEIKRKNYTDVFRLLLKKGALTKQDIVLELGLSLPTVTQNLNQLMESGLVEKKGSVGHTGGRRAMLYSVITDAHTAIGLDITRNHVTAAAVDLNGVIIKSVRKRISFSCTDEYYRALGNIVEEIKEYAELDEKNILGVGIGVPGLITPDNQKIYYGGVLNCTGLLCEELAKYIPYSTALYHDTDTAMLAETWNNPEVKNAFYIMVSTSIGGAVYINDQQYFGENIRCGEIGHLTLVPGGKQCYCGRQGCVDAYCATSVLTAATDGNLALFFERLEKKDPDICKIWNVYIQHLANAVVSIRILFDCDIIIGGYIGSYADIFLEELKEIVAQKTIFEKTAEYLIPCKYKTEGVATGAALNYIVPFLNSI